MMRQTTSPASRAWRRICILVSAALLLATVGACTSGDEIAGLPTGAPTAAEGEVTDNEVADALPPIAAESGDDERSNDISPTATQTPASTPTAVVEPDPTPTSPPAPPTSTPTPAPTPPEPTPAPTPRETPPVAQGGEVGQNTNPGVLNSPVREWDDALEGTDDEVLGLREELVAIEDPSQTQLIYLALTGIRLGETVADDQVAAIAELTDPDVDQSRWAEGYASLIDTVAVLAIDARLIEFEFDYVIDDDLLPFTRRFDLKRLEIPDLLQVPDDGFQIGPNLLDDTGTP